MITTKHSRSPKTERLIPTIASNARSMRSHPFVRHVVSELSATALRRMGLSSVVIIAPRSKVLPNSVIVLDPRDIGFGKIDRCAVALAPEMVLVLAHERNFCRARHPCPSQFVKELLGLCPVTVGGVGCSIETGSAPVLVAIVIVLMIFAFRLGNHFRFLRPRSYDFLACLKQRTWRPYIAMETIENPPKIELLKSQKGPISAKAQ
jgi:hypothetical protein